MSTIRIMLPSLVSGALLGFAIGFELLVSTKAGRRLLRRHLAPYSDEVAPENSENKETK